MGNNVTFKNYIKNIKSFHKFHEELLFINCKNLRHFWHAVSIKNGSPR